jgi:hypothetical protein
LPSVRCGMAFTASSHSLDDWAQRLVVRRGFSDAGDDSADQREHVRDVRHHLTDTPLADAAVRSVFGPDIDAAHDFFGIPSGAHFTARVTRVEQTESFERPLSSRRSSALVNKRRHRYNGSSLRPLRCPHVSFCTRRRHSSSLWLRASRHGTDQRPGRCRAASCRTPPDRGPTDPASPSVITTPSA